MVFVLDEIIVEVIVATASGAVLKLLSAVLPTKCCGPAGGIAETPSATDGNLTSKKLEAVESAQGVSDGNADEELKANEDLRPRRSNCRSLARRRCRKRRASATRAG